MSAAFDTVDHGILLERLEKTHGIKNSALRWIKSYLTDRTQTVVVHDIRSSTKQLVRGVPQGSVLGPVLFLLYTTEIQNIIRSFGLEAHVYADDNQLYFHAAPAEVSSIERRFVTCIQAINQWMSSNRLKLNPDKTEFIWISSQYHARLIQQNAITIGNAAVTPVQCARDLGVQLSSTLTLKNHVSSIVKSCFYQLRQLKYVKRSLNKENMKTLLHAFVTSRLDYCNSLLANQPTTLIARLQSVQNAAARLFAGVSSRSHVTSILRDELHWLRIPQRIDYKICMLVYNCLYGGAPSYLSQYCARLQDSSTRLSRNRSAALKNLIVPRTRTKTHGQRSFAFTGPSTWNLLPTQLKQNLPYCAFKSQLKTHFFKTCYD